MTVMPCASLPACLTGCQLSGRSGSPDCLCRLSALQGQRAQRLRTGGGQGLGLTWAVDAGFLVSAAALRAAGWLPTHTEALGFALGKALRVRFPSHTFHSSTN